MRRSTQPRQPQATRQAQLYCGKCDRGWLLVEDNGDPMYPHHIVATPCSCNPQARTQLQEEHHSLMNQPWYRSAEITEMDRRRKFREEKLNQNPNKDDLKKENVRSTFYVPPSKRGESIIAAKAELARKLYPKKKHDLAFWEKFDNTHPDPQAELLTLESKEHSDNVDATLTENP